MMDTPKGIQLHSLDWPMPILLQQCRWLPLQLVQGDQLWLIKLTIQLQKGLEKSQGNSTLNCTYFIPHE